MTPTRSAVSSGMNHYYHAKDWYLQRDLIEDLKCITSHRADVDPQHVRVPDIAFLLLGEVERLMEGRTHFLQGFVTGIREELLVWPALLKTERPPTVDEVLIKACLTELAMATVKEGTTICLELGDPDPAVLPLRSPASPKPSTRA